MRIRDVFGSVGARVKSACSAAYREFYGDISADSNSTLLREFSTKAPGTGILVQTGEAATVGVTLNEKGIPLAPCAFPSLIFKSKKKEIIREPVRFFFTWLRLKPLAITSTRINFFCREFILIFVLI